MPATAQARHQTSGQSRNSILPSARSASVVFNGQQPWLTLALPSAAPPLNLGWQQPPGCSLQPSAEQHGRAQTACANGKESWEHDMAQWKCSSAIWAQRGAVTAYTSAQRGNLTVTCGLGLFCRQKPTRTSCNKQVLYSNEKSSMYFNCEELFVLPYFPRVPQSKTTKSSYSGNGRFRTSWGFQSQIGGIPAR